MAATRRVQFLMEREEFRRLQALARQRRTSVATLIRSAVREAYLAPQAERGSVVEAILAMRLSIPDWKRSRKQIERGHAGPR